MKKPVKNLKVCYEQEFVSSEHSGGDGPYQGFTETIYSSDVISFTNTEDPKSLHFHWVPDGYYDFDPDGEMPKEAECVFVRYSDGGTFGRSSGYCHVVGLYKDYEKAKKVAESIRAGTFKGYKCWEGYFASLEDVEIKTIPFESVVKQRKF